MTAHELLIQLRALNVRISLAEGRLRVVEPATGTLSQEIWNELKLHKEEICRILQRVAQTGRARSVIPRTERLHDIPLSFAQQRLWFLSQMENVSEAYHLPIALGLTGELDLHALRRALDRIVYRHEALRTTFHRVDGQPVQRVGAPDFGFDLQERDLSGQNARDELQRRTKEEGSRPFDLEHGPLVRGQLLRLAEQEHVLLITMHHIISDGWSIGVLVNELNMLYRAYHAEKEDPLPPLAIQYPDYAVWQRKSLSGEILEQQGEHWLRALEGAPALLELPLDRPRPSHQTFAGDVLELRFDATLTRGLKSLSQRHGMTLYMLAVAAWALVLSRLSGQEEVLIGTVAANRTRPELEALIGFFVNTLVLRVEVKGKVIELLEKVKARTLDAQQRQELPFEHVVEVVRPARSLAYTPIFQVMLAWQSNDPGRFDLPGLDVSPLPTPYKVAKFDLALDLREAGESIVGGLRYATALFNRSTIERHAGYLRQVLAALGTDNGPAVDDLCLLSDAERRQLLHEWNQTQVEYPKDVCIHELFQQQVSRTPEAPAVMFGEERVSYDELNRRANRLAHYLRRKGVEPDTLVGICMKRGVEMIVAMLAVLKGGGAYVPLDPQYPGERLEYMVKDSGPEIILAQWSTEELVRRVAKEVELIEVDDEGWRWDGEAETNPKCGDVGLKPEHLAYVIYTSGSTGMPKGVMLEHRNTVNLICWAHQVFKKEVLARTLFSTSLNFDLAVYECFVPLTWGGSVRVVSDALDMARGGTDVTLINTVPSVMKTLMEEGAVPATVQAINVAGEPLKRPLVEGIFASTQAQQVCNLYGPTETTTYSTWVEMKREEGFLAHIGRPIANTRVYILDRRKEPVPVGVIGEIYIGGAGVARGYLNQEELTAERFVRDPFSGKEGERMYRTGDLGRWLEDGNIEYVGRNDFQVKIRGFRIELGEIEARLAEHPGVRDVVVVAREDHRDEKWLVAYVTAKGPSEDGTAAGKIDSEELRRYLSLHLPDYMVPTAYVLLGSLPLTRNGKLDRKALPSPDGHVYVKRGYEPAVGEMETAVAQIWAEVLKLDRVGRHDNFFELGGHSLLIVKLKSQLQKISIESTVADLFNHPTTESFVASLQKRSKSVPTLGAKRIREGKQTPLFLVHDGGGNELYFSVLAQHLPTELPVYGLPCVPENEPQLHTIQEMAKRMVNLIQEAQEQGPYRVAGWSFGGVLAYEIAQQLLDQGHEVEFLGLMDALCPDGNRSREDHERTPESVLVDLCEAQRVQRSSGRPSMSPFDVPDPNLSFDELLRCYRALHLLPENLECLSSHEARAECLKLELHLRAMEAYCPQPISIPVHLFVAGNRPAGSAARSAALGWEHCLSGYLLNVQVVPGTHQSMMKPPQIEVLGRRLTDSLAATGLQTIACNAS